MTILQAIILGIVQGLTEFIPISSSAHLIFASRAIDLFKGDVLQAQQTTATIAVIQLGTLLAVLVYFARDIMNISIAFVRDHIALLSGRARQNASGDEMFSLSRDAWLGWLVILGSIPIGVVGLLFKKQIEGTFTKNLWMIASMMILIALMLLLAEMIGKQQRDMEHLGVRDALALGFAQVLALLPGASRSGSTITAGLLVGEKRETAARFSFLLSIPAVGASGLLELRVALHQLPAGSHVPLIISTIVSGVVIIALLATGRLSPQIETPTKQTHNQVNGSVSHVASVATMAEFGVRAANNSQRDSVNSNQ